jgi:hypothetical protein
MAALIEDPHEDEDDEVEVGEDVDEVPPLIGPLLFMVSMFCTLLTGAFSIRPTPVILRRFLNEERLR